MSIHGKRQHQLGQVFQRSSIFPTAQANLVGDTPLAVMQPTLLYGTKVGLRNHAEASQDQSRRFCNWSFWESNRRPATSQVGRGIRQILSPKNPLQPVDLLFWLGARRHLCRHLPYAYITGYTTNPPPRQIMYLLTQLIRLNKRQVS